MGEPAGAIGADRPLRANRAFVRLWLAHIASGTGTRVTLTALPLTAVLTVGASPTEMGFLVFASQLPDLLFGLIAGVWVDRRRRKPFLIAADLGRAVLLASLPMAAVLDRLTFAHLWLVAFLVGTLTVLFQLAVVALLPSLVHDQHLVDANSRFALSDAVLSLLGPSAGGILVQLLTAPKALIVDAASYLASALVLIGIDAPETIPPPAAGRSLRLEITEGLRELVRTPVLRILTLSSGIGAIARAVQATVLMLFLVHDLALSPALIGLALAGNGAGALIGAAWGGHIAGRVGVGGAVIGGAGIWAVGDLLLPFIGSAGLVLPLLIAAQLLMGVGATVRLLGRVTAARRFLIFCMAPVGSAIGAVAGEGIGLRATLVVAAAISIVSAGVLCRSPIRHLRDLPGAAAP